MKKLLAGLLGLMFIIVPIMSVGINVAEANVDDLVEYGGGGALILNEAATLYSYGSLAGISSFAIGGPIGLLAVGALLDGDLFGFDPFGKKRSDEERITKAYQACLGRDPEAGAVEFHKDLIKKGTYKIGQIVNAICESEEAKNKEEAGAEDTSISQEFLWKPTSEGDGNLVVLLPNSMKGSVVSAAVQKGGQTIDIGRFSGDTHNGNRPHFRFPKSGASYGGPVELAVMTASGMCAWEIPNGAQRFSATIDRCDSITPETPSDEFLWKPISENDKKLVVLLPYTMRGQVEKVAVIQNKKEVATGRFSGDTQNGMRLHYRFSKAGSGYGKNLYLAASGPTGSCAWEIPDGAKEVRGTTPKCVSGNIESLITQISNASTTTATTTTSTTASTTTSTNAGTLVIDCEISDKSIEVGEDTEISVDIEGGESPYKVRWSGDTSRIKKIGKTKVSQDIEFKKAGKYVLEVKVTDKNNISTEEICSAITVREKGAEEEDDASETSTVTTNNQSTNGLSNYPFNRDLTIGSEGADVTALQDFLITNGFLVMPAGVAKGYFGNVTRDALIRWQKAKGVSPAAGYFGAKSRAVIAGNPVSENTIYVAPATVVVRPAVSAASCVNVTRTLNYQETSSEVSQIQTFLEMKGYLTMPEGAAKGTYGRLTATAIANYMASKNISTSGIVADESVLSQIRKDTGCAN